MRLRFSNAVAWQGIRAAFAEFGRKIREIVARFLPAFERLENEQKRSRPAFWRGVAGRGARFDAPGRVALAVALTANRRPVLPGHMKQKGKG